MDTIQHWRKVKCLFEFFERVSMLLQTLKEVITCVF